MGCEQRNTPCPMKFAIRNTFFFRSDKGSMGDGEKNIQMFVAKNEPQAKAVELAQLGEGCRGQLSPAKSG